MNQDPQGVTLFKRMENDVVHFRFFTIILEAILIGLSFAIATAWSDVIVTTASHWLTSWAMPLQRLIAAIFVTLFSIAAAAFAVFYIIVKPQRKLMELTEHSHIPVSRGDITPVVPQPESRGWFPTLPQSRGI